MPSTFSTNNGLELIADGEQSGTWGATTNTNLNLIDVSLDGQVTIVLPATGSSGSPNDLAISDGAASDGRNRFVQFSDGGDLGGTAFVRLTPNNAEKIMFVQNSLSGGRSINLFQGTYNASNDYTLANGDTVLVRFDGAGASAVVSPVLGTLAGQDSGNVTITGGTITGITDLAVADGGTGASNAGDARTNLGLVIGTNVQAWDADLDTYASNPLASVELDQLQNINSVTISNAQWGYLGAATAFGGSLLDDADAAAGRSTLGLGSLATASTINNSNWSGTDLSVANGGTGASNSTQALENLGLLDAEDTGSFNTGLRVPSGTTGNRPTTPDGTQIRWNTTDSTFEGYNGSAWQGLGGGGGQFRGENGLVGDSPGDIFRVNEQVLNTSTTIGATENASCAGDLEVASGITLTVSSGGSLSIV